MLQFSNGAGLLEEPGRQPSEPAARTAARRTPGELLTTIKMIKFMNEFEGIGIFKEKLH